MAGGVPIADSIDVLVQARLALHIIHSSQPRSGCPPLSMHKWSQLFMELEELDAAGWGPMWQVEGWAFTVTAAHLCQPQVQTKFAPIFVCGLLAEAPPPPPSGRQTRGVWLRAACLGSRPSSPRCPKPFTTVWRLATCNLRLPHSHAPPRSREKV